MDTIGIDPPLFICSIQLIKPPPTIFHSHHAPCPDYILFCLQKYKKGSSSLSLKIRTRNPWCHLNSPFSQRALLYRNKRTLLHAIVRIPVPCIGETLRQSLPVCYKPYTLSVWTLKSPFCKLPALIFTNHQLSLAIGMHTPLRHCACLSLWFIYKIPVNLSISIRNPSLAVNLYTCHPI
ncbi:hypothetical protein C4A75_15560 [Brevibacillus laterosporus]|nr:hypothetical protein C4A75_15560 [Brevibacillus laterosporus]